MLLEILILIRVDREADGKLGIKVHFIQGVEGSFIAFD